MDESATGSVISLRALPRGAAAADRKTGGLSRDPLSRVSADLRRAGIAFVHFTGEAFGESSCRHLGEIST
jgi:hypothetical protein